MATKKKAEATLQTAFKSTSDRDVTPTVVSTGSPKDFDGVSCYEDHMSGKAGRRTEAQEREFYRI